MSDYVIPEIKATEAEMISIRHYLHANPELSLEEFNTSELVASKLTEWGYQVTRGLGKTGVVGSLSKGDSPRTIGLRADMDALPIEETTGLPWASTAPGKMHACGHDGHTTILLAAAKYIASPACQFNGTVHLIFQPAEEAIGGADLMIKDGLFEQFPCERIFGLHNMPGLPVGKLGFYAGNFMASADTVKITITGYGGHGAHPERTVDPIVAGAAHVGQSLFDDRPADALAIEHFKHQIEVAIAHFLRADQLRWVVDAGELLRVSHGIVGGEGMVLRHCLDPRILIKPFRRLYFWIPS